MTRTIPATHADCLAGLHAAQRIVESAGSAYWTYSRDTDACAYHLRIVHEQFAELAKALGYTIAPVAALSGEAA